MPKNINSASRIVGLLKSIPSHPDNTQTLEVWANLFDADRSNPQKLSLIVGERLSAMYRELDLVRTQMEAQDFSTELYAPAINNLEHAFSTMTLHANWPQSRQYFTPEMFVAMSFCGEIIADEEELIPADELAEIADKVRELEESLSGSQLPPRLRVLIEHHIALIRRAIAEYPIAGAKAFRQVARTALGEIVEVRETIQAHADAPELGKLGAIWQRVNAAADVALKIDSLVQVGQKAWKLVEGIIPS